MSKFKNTELIVDYVLSGFGASFRLGSPNEAYAKGVAEELFSSTKFLESETRGDNIEMSALFNAYTEDRMAEQLNGFNLNLRDLYTGGMYVDSGGLQVLTQGKTIDEEMRKKIYKTQASYGDFAMSFDVIPSEFVNGEKIYFPERVADAGTQAGKNLIEQIKAFKEYNTSCKIMPIIQGLGESDMDLYANNMFSQLSKDELDYITSVAFGGGTSGFEFLNRMMNAHHSKILSQKMNHVHLLGITGFSRLLPPIIAAMNGILPDVNRISFDSTTISKTYVLGMVWPEVEDVISGNVKAGASTSLGKIRNDTVEAHYEKMWNWWKKNPNNIFDSVEDLLEHSVYNSKGFTTGYQQTENLSLEDGIKTIAQKHVFVYYNTYNFINILKGYIKGEVPLSNLLGKNQKGIFLFEQLESITDVNDYNDWFIDVKKHIKIDVPSVGSDKGQSTNILF